MKLLAFFLVLTFIATTQALDSVTSLDKHEAAIDQYLDLLASQFVDDIMLQEDKKHQAGDAVTGERNLGLSQETPKVTLRNVPMHRKRPSSQERKLYESLTASYLMGNNDDTTAANQLSILMTQQKAMQNMRAISAWLNDIDTRLDQSRDALNRRMSDLAVGLQRRNMLLGHFNSLGMVSRMGG